MDDLTGKSPAPGGAETQWSSAESNQFTGEAKNLIENSGQTSAPGDLNQIEKAVAGYAAHGDFYDCTGTATAYVLSIIDAYAAPEDLREGFRARFRANINNSGADPTINVAGLGAKTIKNQAGGTIAAGDISTARDSEIRYDGTDFRLGPEGLPAGTAAWPRTHIQGLIMSNDADTDHDISVTSGEARDVGDNTNYSFSGPFVKQIDAAFAVGTGVGGYAATGGLASDTLYRFFLIGHTDGSVDFGFDDDAAAANLLTAAQVIDAGWQRYRQVGWVLTDGSSDILEFFHDPNSPDDFYYLDWVNFVAALAFHTTDNLTTVTGAPPNTVASILNYVDVLIGATLLGDLGSMLFWHTDLSTQPARWDVMFWADGSVRVRKSDVLQIPVDSSSQVLISASGIDALVNYTTYTTGFRFDRRAAG